MKEKRQNSQEPVVDIENLKIGFNGNEVLTNITMQLHEGENLVVLGRSGCGKSVLAKCIIGLLRCDEGKVSVLGRNIPELSLTELNELRRKMGYLFQSGALYDSMTVRENLGFQLKRINRTLSLADISEKVAEALENVGLINAADKMPSELSGGMRKRIGLARTIVAEPEIILYDEPTTGLDPVTSDEISVLINHIKERYKASSLIITHDIRCVKMVADRILMLNNGEVYKSGNPDSFETSGDPFIKQFFK